MVGKSHKTAQQNSETLKTPDPTLQPSATLTATSKDDNLDARTEGPSTEVLTTTRSMQRDFSKRFEDVLVGIRLDGELQNQATRITETRERIERAEDNLDEMLSTINMLKEKCVKEQENRLRFIYSQSGWANCG